MRVRNKSIEDVWTNMKFFGDLHEVIFDKRFRCIYIKNRGDSEVRVSFEREPPDEDVVVIEPKHAALLAHREITDTLYIEGISRIRVCMGESPADILRNVKGGLYYAKNN